MKILVIKTGAIGDVLRTSFIAQALKDKYRIHNPEIFWITDKKAKPLFINNPYINHVLVSEEKDKVANIYFDIIINLEEDETNCKFASKIRAKKRIGFIWKEEKVCPSESAKEWFDMSALGEKPQNDILKKENKKTHRQIIAEIAGINNYLKYEPFLRLTQWQRKFAQDFLRRHNLSREELIIGINTGAADRWPKALSIKKTALVIDQLYKKYNAKILLFGGPNEIERNREILRLSESPIITTGSGNDLVEFPALISVCTLVITTDSLGLHIALALKRKTISLIGPTSSSEIEMYGLGEKIIAKSKCLCCYKKDCKSMENMDVEEIVTKAKSVLNEKISLVITNFRKSENFAKALKSAMTQKTKHNYDIIVPVSDDRTLDIAKEQEKKDKSIKIIKCSFDDDTKVIDFILKEVHSNIIVLTDGSAHISEKALEEVIKVFSDPEVGCVSGRPSPVEERETKYGYWAHFLFEAAHRLRKEASKSNKFIECSGHLFAFRSDKIKSIPSDAAWAAIIPYYLWERGYRIEYAENAQVYVKSADNLREWIGQRTESGSAHENLHKYVDIKTTPRSKTFLNEAKGIKLLLDYPSSFKERIWSCELLLARLLIWVKVFLRRRK
jgi:heptosyltransferase-2